MSALTRDLLPYAVGRAVTENVILITYKDLQPSDALDGSYRYFKEETETKARVVALTSNEIERLAAGGLTLNRGVRVALVGEVTKDPDQIVRASGVVLKVMQSTVEEGASVFLCDIAPLGEDGTSYGSGYSQP